MNEVYCNSTDPNYHKKIKIKDLKQKLIGACNLKKAGRKKEGGRGAKTDFWMCNHPEGKPRSQVPVHRFLGVTGHFQRGYCGYPK